MRPSPHHPPSRRTPRTTTRLRSTREKVRKASPSSRPGVGTLTGRRVGRPRRCSTARLFEALTYKPATPAPAVEKAGAPAGADQAADDSRKAPTSATCDHGAAAGAAARSRLFPSGDLRARFTAASFGPRPFCHSSLFPFPASGRFLSPRRPPAGLLLFAPAADRTTAGGVIRARTRWRRSARGSPRARHTPTPYCLRVSSAITVSPQPSRSSSPKAFISRCRRFADDRRLMPGAWNQRRAVPDDRALTRHQLGAPYRRPETAAQLRPASAPRAGHYRSRRQCFSLACTVAGPAVSDSTIRSRAGEGAEQTVVRASRT